MIIYAFYIRVDMDGSQTPLMNTGYGYESHLSNLAIGHMRYSETVFKELTEINKVLNLEKINHFLCYSETICLDVSHADTLVYNNIGDVYFEPFKMPSKEIYELLSKWYEFLKKYENGGIPGITKSL